MMDLLENGVNDTCHHCLCHLIAGNEINFIFICSTTSLSATKVHYWPTPAYHYPVTRQTAPEFKAAIQHESFSTVRQAGIGQMQPLN
jgi:hypothetical protein